MPFPSVTKLTSAMQGAVCWGPMTEHSSGGWMATCREQSVRARARVHVCVCVCVCVPGHTHVCASACGLQHSPQQLRIWAASATYIDELCWILNLLREARDWNRHLMVTSQVPSASPQQELYFFWGGVHVFTKLFHISSREICLQKPDLIFLYPKGISLVFCFLLFFSFVLNQGLIMGRCNLPQIGVRHHWYLKIF